MNLNFFLQFIKSGFSIYALNQGLHTHTFIHNWNRAIPAFAFPAITDNHLPTPVEIWQYEGQKPVFE